MSPTIVAGSVIEKFFCIKGTLLVATPKISNGSNDGVFPIPPDGGPTVELVKIDLPTVCWYNSAATLDLNSC